MGQISGPRSHVSLSILKRLLLAIAMQTWDLSLGHFAKIRCFCHFGPHWEHHMSFGQEMELGRSRNSCSIVPSTNRPRFSYLLVWNSCHYATYGALHVFQICISCCFLPCRVTIPSGNSTQPTSQQAELRCTGPKGKSRPVNQGLADEIATRANPGRPPKTVTFADFGNLTRRGHPVAPSCH